MPSSTGTLVFNDQKIQAPDIYATESLGVGVSDPTSNLQVVGNAYVSSNLEVGTANLFVDTTTGRVGIGKTDPLFKLDIETSTNYVPSVRIGDQTTYSDDELYSLRIGASSVMGMGTHSSTRGAFGKQGLAIHIPNTEEFSVKTNGWLNCFAIDGATRKLALGGTDHMIFDSTGVMYHGTRAYNSTETRFVYLNQRGGTGPTYYFVSAGSTSSATSWNGYPGVWSSENGEFRVHGNGPTYTCAVRADGGNLTFTGSHDTFTPFSEDDVGKIVYSTGEYSTELKEGVMYNELTVMDSCPVVSLATQENDKRVMGVLSRRITKVNTEKITSDEYNALVDKSEYSQLPSDSNVYIKNIDTGEFSKGYYNAVGEGGIWVTNKNGNFENGDYIVSSTLPGYGQKQNDDLLHNFTVAKITSDCDFTDIQVIKQRHTSVDGIYQYNENGEPIRENVLDENGNTITFSKFKLRYLLPDGTQITKEEYDLATEAYIAAFVGCTYHCG